MIHFSNIAIYTYNYPGTYLLVINFKLSKMRPPKTNYPEPLWCSSCCSMPVKDTSKQLQQVAHSVLMNDHSLEEKLLSYDCSIDVFAADERQFLFSLCRSCGRCSIYNSSSCISCVTVNAGVRIHCHARIRLVVRWVIGWINKWRVG